LSDYLANSGTTLIANYVFARFAYPLYSVELKQLKLDYTFVDKYSLNFKFKSRWSVLSDGENLSDFNQAASSGVTLSVSAEQVLTGGKALKCAVGATPTGYISVSLPYTAFTPREVRAYVYLEAGSSIIIEAVSDTGATYLKTITNPAAIASWLSVNFEVTNKLNDPYVLAGLFPVPKYAIKLPSTLLGGTFTLRCTSTPANYLLNIAEVRIRWVTPNTTLYVDLVDLKHSSYATRQLYATKRVFTIVNNVLQADIVFGETVDDLTDDLLSTAKQIATITNVFTKT
jgi:hypothetical protein